MTIQISDLKIVAKILCSVLPAVGLLGIVPASAQNNSGAFYHFVVAPQIANQAAVEAEIRARP